jgi:hypothetical protein
MLRPMRMFLFASLALVWGGVAHAASDADGALLTSMVTAAAGADARMDVLSTTDVKKALDVEAQKTLAGCDEAAGSCLAEIAAAMDARSVLHGSVGQLGTDTVLTLSLFDTMSASAVGRVVVKDKTISAVADRVEAAVKELLVKVPTLKDGQRTRVLVIDLDVLPSNGSDEAAAPAAPEPPTLTTTAGIITATTGGLALLLAVTCEQLAADANTKLASPATLANDVESIVETRGYAVPVGQASWIVGGLLVVGGAALVFVPVLVGE